MNQNQQKITEARGHSICVAASAGTGKTTVLIERIISLVQQDNIPVSKILAITFTEKAAQELKTRLSAALRERELPYWATETAYISTFHAFCARVLRENFFQSGLPPDFKTLPGIPGKLLLAEAVNAVIDRRLKSDDPEIIGFLEKYPRDTLIKNTADILLAIHSAGYEPQDLKSDNITENILRINNEYLRSIYLTIQQTAERLRNLPADKAKTAELCAQLLQICAKEFARERFLEIQELFEGARLAKDSAAGEILNQIRGLCHKDLKKYPDSCSLFFNYNEDNERAFGQLTQEYLQLLSEVSREYSARKAREHWLDFEDLQLKTLALFRQKPEIAEFYRNYFQAVLVDEFQDTNGLQDKLLRQIAGKNNLFIVGDRKQSIYLFRYADQELFERYSQEIKDSGGLVMPLAENYRCAQNILDLTNLVCRQLFGTEYPDLKPGRPEQIAAPGEAKIIFLAKELDERAEDIRAKEARYIARQLKALAGQDNAILLPKNTQQEVYTDALEAEGLAYTVLSGGAYYRRGEILDTLNLLQVLNNPDDDLKLAAVLRSEMVSLSDSAFFLLTREKRERPLFSLLTPDCPGLTTEDADKLQNFLTIYQELRACLGKLPVWQIVRLAMEKTIFTRIALTHRERAEQVSANLQKLLEIAKDPLFARRDLPYFISYIEKLQEDKESEAETDDRQNTIKILSIHKAKGLEFDNVFLADIYNHSGDQVSDNPFNKKLAEQGIPLALKYKEAGQDFLSLAHLHSQRINSELEAAERKRLFYVAATRAKKRLQIVSAYPLVKAKETGEISEKILDPACLQTQNIGGWLRYLYQQNKLPENLTVQNPVVPPAPAGRSAAKLPTVLPPEEKYLPLLKEAYELNSLNAGLLSSLFTAPEDFVPDYFHGFPTPAPRTYSQFSAEIMQQIGNAVHNAIELNKKTYTDPRFNAAQNEYLQKCLNNYYQSEIYTLTKNHPHYLELDLEYLADNVRYYGRADLIIQTEQEILVYDFKTGEAEDAKHKAQISVYAAILQKHFPAKTIKGCVFYLHNNQRTEVDLNLNIFAECLAKLTRYSA